MNSMTRRITLAATLAFCLPSGVFRGSDKPGQPKVLTVCELVASWKNYNRQKVLVRAIFAVGAEQSVVYDPACKDESIATEFREDVKGRYKKLDHIVSKNRLNKRAWVVFEGVFFGPEPFSEDELSPLPPHIREHFAKGHRRYGHMGAFDSMIEVSKVVEAKEVAAEVP